MGIRLDWEIEADQQQVRQVGEDPLMRRRRRVVRLRIALGIALVIAAVVGAAGAVVLRLRAVEERAERLLRSAVEAETAALRIGDEAAFLALQRSATDDWIVQQQQTFNDYQALKAARDVRLTGRVVDVAIDDQRGRVLIEEIVDGTPFVRTWFFWRYEDGWRHVPPDYTFWGEAQALQGRHTTAYYREMDARFAQAVVETADSWLAHGCAALGCASVPALTVEIVPDETAQAAWAPGEVWSLRLPSPYVGAARLDQPFDLNRQLEAAGLLAERLVDTVSGRLAPVFPNDAYYLRTAVISWLVGRFAQINTNSFLVASLAESYGEAAVGALVRALRPDSGVDVIAAVTGVPLDQAGLDWRDFLTWRLTVEDELLKRGEESAFLALYDTRSEDTRLLAYARFAAGPTGERRVVVSAIAEDDPAGGVRLRAIAQVGAGGSATRQEAALFRVSDGQWRRVS